MKKLMNLSLSLMVTALALVSCSQSDEMPIEDQDKGAEAVMTVNFENPKSRASGTPTGESNITSGTIMVFRAGSGILDGMKTFTSIGTPINVKITAGQRDVYVVANTGISFASITNVADLKNMASKYALTSISATGTALPMSGKTATTVNASSATIATPATASVTLNYMCSKVSIVWDLSALNQSLTGFTVKKVYVMNVPSVTDCFAFSPDILTTYSTAYSTGKINPQTFSASSYYPATPFTNAYLASLELDPAGTSGDNFFYVFENNVTASPTIAVIEGTLGATTYYYPIVINGSQNSANENTTATVTRGRAYKVTAKIKGFGNTDPYEPIVNASMDVTIIAPQWTPIAIDQTFE